MLREKENSDIIYGKGGSKGSDAYFNPRNETFLQMIRLNLFPNIRVKSFTTFHICIVSIIFIVTIMHAGLEPNDEFLAPHRTTLFNLGEKFPFFIVHHRQYWRLLTSLYLHANLIHLIINSITFILIGSKMEILLGTKWTIMTFFLSGFQGSVISSLLDSEPQVCSSIPTMFFIGISIASKFDYTDNLPLSEKDKNPKNIYRELYQGFSFNKNLLKICGLLLLALINLLLGKIYSRSIDFDGTFSVFCIAFLYRWSELFLSFPFNKIKKELVFYVFMTAFSSVGCIILFFYCNPELY